MSVLSIRIKDVERFGITFICNANKGNVNIFRYLLHWSEEKGVIIISEQWKQDDSFHTHFLNNTVWHQAFFFLT